MLKRIVLFVAFSFALQAATVTGRITDPQGNPVAGATVRAGASESTSDSKGNYSLELPAGAYSLTATSADFATITHPVRIADQPLSVDVQFTRLAPHNDSVTVTADVHDLGIQHPDPSQRVNVRDDLLDANPGRPGIPVSIPGLPAETASGGLKAPQYFAPGVAGDHGEPIAQYLQVGSFLVPNNLSANAHGNGYSDPNIMIPATVESAQTDGGAFNVLEGNHAVDLAAAYGFRQRLEPFATLTGDYRDIDLVAGWSPADVTKRAWVAIEAAYGNGFLDTLEHRQQYKLNGFRVFDAGNHQITVYGAGYYGQSAIPGLVPLGVPNLHDTIDPRQHDQTQTTEMVVNDVWHATPATDLQFSSFFRTYNLSLLSNFGDGLIRQSEFRTVNGENFNYIRKINRRLSYLAGMDYFREAPRRLDLDRYDPFTAVTANNVTMHFLSPYAAIDGFATSWLHYNLGWRRDEIHFDNVDLLNSTNSFRTWVGVDSPKATLSLLPPEHLWLPSVSMSVGQAFFTNDPRIGAGTTPGTPVSRAHSAQLVVSKTVLGTDLRVTLGRVTQEQSLAKIDPDTGLQYNQGPGRNRYITISARRTFRGGTLQASFSKADARDISDGTPIPEAPRLIADFVGTFDRLPFGLHARYEFEEVGSKPLGDGFVSVPVREFRGALTRQFGARVQAGINFMLASGYTGQTTEFLPDETVVGVRLPSYVTLSFNYRFGPKPTAAR